MGVSINARIFNVDDVVKHMNAMLIEHSETRRPQATATPLEFLEKVGPSFGYYDGKIFVMVYNEYYEDYNPTSNFSNAVNMYYYGTSDTYELMDSFEDVFPWLSGIDVEGGAEKMDSDTAQELGLDYPDRDIFDEDDDY